MSILFVAGKVETVKLSYEIRGKERKMAEEYEAMKNLRYHLASLKSPAQLENRMIETELGLIPVQEVRVLRFAKRKLPEPQKSLAGPVSRGPSHFLTVREAQAETNG